MAKMYVTRRAVFTHATTKVVNLHTDEIDTVVNHLMGYYASLNDALDAVSKGYRDNVDVKPIAVTELSYTIDTMGMSAEVWRDNCNVIKTEDIAPEDAAMFGKRASVDAEND